MVAILGIKFDKWKKYILLLFLFLKKEFGNTPLGSRYTKIKSIQYFGIMIGSNILMNPDIS